MTGLLALYVAVVFGLVAASSLLEDSWYVLYFDGEHSRPVTRWLAVALAREFGGDVRRL